MKKLFITGLILVFLAGIVSALNIGVISGPAGNSILENETAVIGLQTDYSVSSFGSNVTGISIVQTSPTTANATYTPGFDSSKSDKVVYISFTATNGTDPVSVPYTLTVKNVNRAPSANPGANQNVDVNKTATLDGSGSSDPDGDSLTYAWTEVSGPTVTLSSSSVASPTFVPSQSGTYVFSLTVSDGQLSNTKQVTFTANVAQMLIFKDIEVKIGTKKESGLENKADGFEIARDAKPGDKITVTVDLKNVYTTDMSIEDVYMKARIEGIDDGDDLEEETDSKDLSDGKTSSFKVEFTVPNKLDNDKYDMFIDAEGTDENGKDFSLSKQLVLSIDKESHDIRIEQAEFNPASISCNRNAQLNINVLNMGQEDEQEIRITAINSALGIDYTAWDDGDIELSAGSDDDAEYSVSVPVDAKNVQPGTYNVDIKVYRDETRIMDSATAQLVVQKCTVTQPVESNDDSDYEDNSDTEVDSGNQQNQQTKNDNVDVVVSPNQGQFQPQGQTYPVVAVEETSFTNSAAYMVLLGVASLILVVFIVAILVLLLRRR